MIYQFSAQFYAPLINGKRALGTAYPIAKGLVITARHVVFPSGRDTSKLCEIVWSECKDKSGKPFKREITEIIFEGNEEIDVAVVRCETPPEFDISFVLSDSDPTEGEHWDSVGYPKAGEDTTKTRKPIADEGVFLLPNTDSPELSLKSGGVDGLSKRGAFITENIMEINTKKELWRGMSGAMVFDRKTKKLVGVTSKIPENFDNRLYATSIPYLLRTNAKFRKAIRYQEKVCGIIANFEDTGHATYWGNVKNILTAAINDAGFKVTFLKNDIESLYHAEIVVCDISFFDSSVMFNLGLRLAFNKPIIIIKNSEEKQYPPSIASLKYLTDNCIVYPISNVEEVRYKLSDKIKSEFEASDTGSNYESFLKSIKLPCPKAQFTLEYVSAQMDKLDRNELNKVGKLTITEYLEQLKKSNVSEEEINKIEVKFLQYVYAYNRIGVGIYTGALDRKVVYNPWTPFYFKERWKTFRTFLEKKREERSRNREMGVFFDWLVFDESDELLKELKKTNKSFPLKPENKESYFEFLGVEEYKKYKKDYPKTPSQHRDDIDE